MKKEVRQLKTKATSALTLAIDHFNRPWDVGRAEAVLILLDHSFEMLLKAIIRHRGGRIRNPRERQTIGFDACVRRALSDGEIKFINVEQALTLQAINGLRDAAQHYLLEVSEQQLYLYAQAGVTLFRDLHDAIFDTAPLSVDLPSRVLPISTQLPQDITALFENEAEEIRQLLLPGNRKKLEAAAKLRSIALLEGAINGDFEQPGDKEIGELCRKLAEGEHWHALFPGVASIDIVPGGEGPNISLHLTRKEGTPVRILAEGEREEAAVAIKKVNLLDFYNMGFRKLAEHFDIGPNYLAAAVWRLNIQNDEECFKIIRIGGSEHKRYSGKAIEKIREGLEGLDLKELYREFIISMRERQASRIRRVRTPAQR